MKKKIIKEESFKKYFWLRVKVGKKNECWLWLKSLKGNGYGDCRISDGRRGSHRIAYELYTGINPGKKFVLHKCDNRACCNPHHLFLGTIQDNRKDCVDKERHARGELNGGAKITEKIAIKVYRAYWDQSLSNNDIALKFKISFNTVMRVGSGKAWSHVTSSIKVNKDLKCKRCNQQFLFLKGIRQHLSTVHKNKNKENLK